MEREFESASTITRVERQKGDKKRYNVYVDDEFAFSVHEDVWLKHRLLKGTKVERRWLEEVLFEDQVHAAYLDAVRYLARKIRSKKEVMERLRTKGYGREIIEQAVMKLEEQRMVDDEAFSRLLADFRLRSQKKGSRWIMHELKQRGVNDKHIAGAMEELSPQEEYRLAYEAGKKKWRQTEGGGKNAAEKTAAFLLRRGFPPSMVRRVIRELANSVSEKQEGE